MKIRLFLVFLACSLSVQSQLVDIHKMSGPDQSRKALKHVVLFKFKEGAPPDAISEIERAFASLPSRIPVIKAFEWGVNNSPEGLDKGFTHCFILTFSSEADRDEYLPHPDHREFGRVLSPWLEDVLVVDYWARPGLE